MGILKLNNLIKLRFLNSICQRCVCAMIVLNDLGSVNLGMIFGDLINDDLFGRMLVLLEKQVNF